MSLREDYRVALEAIGRKWTDARAEWADAAAKAIKHHGYATAKEIAEIRRGSEYACQNEFAEPWKALRDMERFGLLDSHKHGHSVRFYYHGAAPARERKRPERKMPEPHHPADKPSVAKRLRRGFEDDLACARGNLNLARWHVAEAMRLVKSSAAVMRNAKATAREQKALLDAEHDLDAIQVQLAVIAGADPGRPAVDLRELTRQLERALDDESLKAMTVAQAQRTSVR